MATTEAVSFYKKNKALYDTCKPIVIKVLSSMADKPTTLTPGLVLAIIKQESEGKPFAFRYEPDFYQWLVSRVPDPDVFGPYYISKATELKARSTSWGLMQVMGQVARERGFKESYLTALCDATCGVTYGCKQLSLLLKRYNTLAEAVASYNTGSPKYTNDMQFVNQEYVDNVLNYATLFQELLDEGR